MILLCKGDYEEMILGLALMVGYVIPRYIGGIVSFG